MMETKTFVFLILTIFSYILSVGGVGHAYEGKWKVLKRSIGVSAMHMQLLPNDKVIVFDRTNFGPSNISLPDGRCTSSMQSPDCYAHSVEFDPVSRNIRPLTILSDTWCSSGSLTPDGLLLQSGGFRLGERVVRSFQPCKDCDWVEVPNGLISPRWYASSQVLPDGRIIIVGGRYQFNYEFIPKDAASAQTLHQLPFLKETLYAPLVPNNLYPFLHLSPDGNLFIFANDRAILLDYNNNVVVKEYPVLPGGVSRNYPSTGSSVLLPLILKSKASAVPNAEVLVCGGTLSDSNQKANAGEFISASRSCGRITINAPDPSWEIEEMPLYRVMGDMIMLPTGDVLIINGAAKGTAGWNAAREPVLNPVLYNSGVHQINNGRRFQVLSPSGIPRLYHSTAHLLSDGRVLVGGSNPNRNYNFTTIFPTELSLEAFYPPYLSNKLPRPVIENITPGTKIGYKAKFYVKFRINNPKKLGKVYVTMVAPSFTTHSFAMNQRLLVLGSDNGVQKAENGTYVVNVTSPETATLAPPGYYQLFVVHEGVPSKGAWVHIK